MHTNAAQQTSCANSSINREKDKGLSDSTVNRTFTFSYRYFALTRRQCVLTGLLIFLFAALFPSVQARVRKANFDQQRIQIDFDLTQPLIFADLDNDGAQEIIALGTDLDKRRLLAVFQNQAGWHLRQKLLLNESLIQVDIQRQKGAGDRLLFLDNQGIWRYEYAENRLQRELESESIYVQARSQYLAEADFARDLNGDGNDDLIIAGIRNTKIFCWQPQTRSWSLSVLNAPPWVDQQFRGANFRLLDFYAADMNGDGLSDLVQASGEVLDIYYAINDHQFSPNAARQALKQPVWAVEWWRLRDASGETADQSHIDHRRLSALQDLNGDKIADMMIRRELSSGVLERKVHYEFYFGRKKGHQVVFPEQADSHIEIEGTLERFRLIDLDGDGRFELISGSFEIGVSQVIGALLSGSIDEEIRVFSLKSEMRYNQEPALEKDVSLNFSLSSGKSGVPVVLTADLDGDKHKELILSRGEKKLSIHQGRGDDDLLSYRAKRYKLVLPKEGDMLRASDLDGDGREELILRYGKQDDKQLRRTITILSYQDAVN